MREFLADEGYAVEIVRGEQDAYERIRQQRPALAILDVRLEHPEAGWEIATLLRLDPDTATLPLIICSADAQFLKAKADQLRAQRCEILEKPFMLDDLLAKVHAVLPR
jgi:DNA-binding response OmpR family regulator